MNSRLLFLCLLVPLLSAHADSPPTKPPARDNDAPAAVEGLQIEAPYRAYQAAWYQLWQQWRGDAREFGHIRFLEQNFDSVAAGEIAQPAGTWGDMAYNPQLHVCAGEWQHLGDGSDARPSAQSLVRHGNAGKAIRLTRAADGSGALSGLHNASPDRGKYASVVDTSMTSGHCTFEFWLMRKTADSAVAAYLQGDDRDFEAGLRVSPGDGRISYSVGTSHGAGDWRETRLALPAGKWQKFTLDVDIDHLRYSAITGDGAASGLWMDVPLSPAKPRSAEQPGFKEFKSVLFVPEGVPGNVTYLDDVAVHWRPSAPFVDRGEKVEFTDDFEGEGSAASWKLPPGCGISSDTSFGPGVKSLRVTGGSPVTLGAPHPLTAGTRITVDLDVFVRSGERGLALLPGAAASHPHSTSIGFREASGRMVAGVSSGEGFWQVWNDGSWKPGTVPVHYDVWNHVQLAMNEAGVGNVVVQPVGQVAAFVGNGRSVGATPGAEVTLTIDPSATLGHLSYYDNVAITSGARTQKRPVGALPVLNVPVLVHLMQSATQPALNTTLSVQEVVRIFEKVNRIWAQGAIHFDLQPVVHTRAKDLTRMARFTQDADLMKAVVPRESLDPAAINVYYVHEQGPNGFYYGDAISVKDTVRLKSVPGGMDDWLARDTAHELGHALGLVHRQDGANLMASGVTGFALDQEEVEKTRIKAAAYQARKLEGAYK